jgi:hypothetical protein
MLFLELPYLDGQRYKPGIVIHFIALQPKKGRIVEVIPPGGRRG